MESIKSTPIILSLIAALLLSVWPISLAYQFYRPEFVVLIVFYWARVYPFRVSLVSIWFLGLAIDLLRSDVACQSALGLTVVTYFLLVFHSFFRKADLLSEMFMLAALMIVYLLTGLWVVALAGDLVWRMDFLYTIVSTVLLWPVVKWVLVSINEKQ